MGLETEIHPESKQRGQTLSGETFQIESTVDNIVDSAPP